jgi:glycosyltransferase involved in cell wall biosynthesis
MKRSILFICKVGHGYGSSYQRRSSGLVNSAALVARALEGQGVRCKVAEAVDNNCIDRLVFEFQPDVVIVEALWVVPEKFKELMNLPHHKGREWYVHVHSNIPFLAHEGIATDWLLRYRKLGVGFIANCERAFEALTAMFGPAQIHFLPNVYESEMRPPERAVRDHVLCVGCFGAIRPMKNQLTQAMAALEYARETNRYLLFHVNATRTENQGDAILKSLRGLFAGVRGELVENPWMDHGAFKRTVSMMDISMQVSLSETFNIVTADAVSSGVPVVVSDEIGWTSLLSQADCASTRSIKSAMRFAEGNRWLVRLNQWHLRRYSANALKRWFLFASRCA